MDELVAKFLPRFTALARDRLRKALETAIDRRADRAETTAHDLHALAGEAGLLGLEQVITVARDAELAARRFGASSAEVDAVALVESVQAVERAVTEATRERGA